MINFIHTKILKKNISLFVLSVGMLTGFVGNLSAKERIVLEQNTAEIIKLKEPADKVYLSNPDIADVKENSTTVYVVYGLKPGITTLFAGVEGNITTQIEIEVVQNISALKRAIRSAYPNENINIISGPAGIILSGKVSNAKTSSDIFNIAQRYVPHKDGVLNNLQIVEPTQVYLRVKVAEVNRTVLKQLDINWQATADFGSYTIGVLTGRNPLVGTGTNPTTFSRSGSTAAGGTNGNSIGFRGRSRGHFDISMLLDALNLEGLGTVLAEPNLVALSGETAKVLVGGEFPYPVPQENSITIEFKQFGISLDFTPTILAGQLINLRVRPEVSELDRTNGISFAFNGGTAEVPAIRTRRAETSVEMGSGDSLAIAGLFANTMSKELSQLPGLGDIPVFGALFRSAKFQRNETELVIIVTPYIVQPVSHQKMHIPMENLRYASHLETILRNRLNTFDSPVSNDCPDCPDGKYMGLSSEDGNVKGVIFEQPLNAVMESTDRAAGPTPSSGAVLAGQAGFYSE